MDIKPIFDWLPIGSTRRSDVCVNGMFLNFRMDDALQILRSKSNPNGRWLLQAKHPGQVHFDMEKTGQPSRWNTLRAFRVLKTYRNH